MSIRQPGSPPKKYKSSASEERWASYWQESQVYAWSSSGSREANFVIDTPPPTVSGSLHLGHAFSYTQTDVIARYQRMQGKAVFYPMGWDDNGLPTERRVQNYFNIRCEPSMPYDPAWKPKKVGKVTQQVSRRNFIEACIALTKEDEIAFEQLWRKLGLSVDWNIQYATIDDHCRKTAQFSFLDLHQRGFPYQADAPTMWDVDFRSAVAQAEIEDREIPGAYHDIRFAVEGGGEFMISTTRPELLCACVAVVAHPDDKRYQHLFGKTAVTPLFYAPVPIMPAAHADPEKGTGSLMVCTFGDIMDVEFWRQEGLPLKQVIGLDGKLTHVVFGDAPFESRQAVRAQAAYSRIEGLPAKKARTVMAQMLAEPESSVGGNEAALVGDPKAITHSVKFYEKGDRPLEFVPTRQWFIRILDHKEALKQQGRKIQWSPAHMHTRYENWVEGLNQDWCISRQRYFGVPFPVWFGVDNSGQVDYESPICALKEALPVDPMIDTPPGFEENQRGRPGGFVGDPDVMDTWATSSLTPQIVSRWVENSELHSELLPMDIRPQAHEIIRTWAFYTIVKAWAHQQTIPWKHAIISGWVLDPDRKKMSKSAGNVITPHDLLERYSSDAIRYWAALARLGVDTAVDESIFRIGQKLVTKLFNASKFALIRLGGEAPPEVSSITQELDRAFVERMRGVITQATRCFDVFEYANALQSIEESFWYFCDHYIELVKSRAYQAEDLLGRASAHATLGWALGLFVRLFAPFIPFITEEVWSWLPQRIATTTSVHISPWPTVAEVAVVEKPAHVEVFPAAVEVMSKIRGRKSEASRSLKWPVDLVRVRCSATVRDALLSVEADIIQAGNIRNGGLVFDPHALDTLDVEVLLGAASST